MSNWLGCIVNFNNWRVGWSSGYYPHQDTTKIYWFLFIGFIWGDEQDIDVWKN
jgi:hypothetical protein